MPDVVTTSRDINIAIRQRMEASPIVRVGGLTGQHHIATGLSRADAKVTVEGNAGDYFGAFNSGTSLSLRGDARHYLGDGMTGGLVNVSGDVGAGAGVYALGGTIIVRKSCLGQLGNMSKDSTIVVCGDAGVDVGARLLSGEIFVVGDAGVDVGNNMVGGKIFVGGTMGRCGKNAQAAKLDQDDKKRIRELFTKYGISGEFRFKKVVPKTSAPLALARGSGRGVE